MKFIMGIDPGWSGGVAVVELESRQGISVGFVDKTEKDIAEVIASFAKGCLVCYIEKVHSMPGQGVASMFKFGHIYGFLRGCLVSYEIPMIEVSPQRWQSALNCLSHGDKNVTKAMAQSLYPKLKVTHATADALLIATYGYKEYCALKHGEESLS